MKWTNQNQALFELDALTAHSHPGPLRSVVRGFSRYVEEVGSLDFVERLRLKVVVEFVHSSFSPGSLPIQGIHVVGHADTDYQRGTRFEQEISEHRAQKVQKYLRDEVARKTVLQMRPMDIPTPEKISWYAPRGVGATQPDQDNIKRGKTPQNMNEDDRKRNRRVEVVLEPGDVPMPGADPDWTTRFTRFLEDIFGRRRPIHPKPPPPNPLPPWMWDPKVMPRLRDPNELRKYLEKIKDWFESHYTDPDPFLDALKNVLFRDDNWPLNEDFAKELRRRGYTL